MLPVVVEGVYDSNFIIVDHWNLSPIFIAVAYFRACDCFLNDVINTNIFRTQLRSFVLEDQMTSSSD